MLSSPFWLARVAMKTAYIVTDQRAVIIEGGWYATVRSISAGRFGEVFRRERRNGKGDLIFSEILTRDSGGDRSRPDAGFRDIQDVREVEQLVKNLTPRAVPWEAAPTSW